MPPASPTRYRYRSRNTPPARPERFAAAPLVLTRGDRRTLEFIPGNVQSEMRVSRPLDLVLPYCRALMCFALFVARPQHIVMVGLGGGSLLKFCYRHFPKARISVIERRADVIALRGAFCVPPDDDRLRVVHADALDWLAHQSDCIDVLLLDGFDESGLPPELGSARFYGHCRRALRHGGVLATNIFSYDPHTPAMLARLRLMFDDRVCQFDGIAGNNQIVFAVKAPLAPHAASAHQLRMVRLVSRHAGLGSARLNGLLAQAVVRWLSWF